MRMMYISICHLSIVHMNHNVHIHAYDKYSYYNRNLLNAYICVSICVLNASSIFYNVNM